MDGDTIKVRARRPAASGCATSASTRPRRSSPTRRCSASRAGRRPRTAPRRGSRPPRARRRGARPLRAAAGLRLARPRRALVNARARPRRLRPHAHDPAQRPLRAPLRRLAAEARARGAGYGAPARRRSSLTPRWRSACDRAWPSSRPSPRRPSRTATRREELRRAGGAALRRAPPRAPAQARVDALRAARPHPLATAVLVTVAMFQALYLVMG